jgi:hypothetical protein
MFIGAKAKTVSAALTRLAIGETLAAMVRIKPKGETR